jgi:hypothetical protein
LPLRCSATHSLLPFTEEGYFADTPYGPGVTFTSGETIAFMHERIALKGFNQTGVSDIIHRTDPRAQMEANGKAHE